MRENYVNIVFTSEKFSVIVMELTIGLSLLLSAVPVPPVEFVASRTVPTANFLYRRPLHEEQGKT